MADIMVFEADSNKRALIRCILEGMHYGIREAGHASDVPGLLAEHVPQLAIFGVRLEDGSDGEEAMHQLRKLAPHVPAIAVLTGNLSRKEDFLGSLGGDELALMERALQPYQLLAQVKAALTEPVEFREGQHRV